MHHTISVQQFDVKMLALLFNEADKMRALNATPNGLKNLSKRHNGKIVATLFYEPSTRTRLSFESAAQRLGAGVISTENAAEFSSAIKGETIEDTVKVVGQYADVIVIRHKETGIVGRAAEVSPVPIINAGDGKGEHPTQPLLDAYTIYREKGTLEGLHVVMGGDLANGRTVRSLAQLLSLYPKNHISFVSTPEFQIDDVVTRVLDERGTSYELREDIDIVKNADVVYWTRLQKERLTLNTPTALEYQINAGVLHTMSPDAIIMHPLPRVQEITTDVDIDPRAAYFRQAGNGLYIRMALLDMLLSE